ncbi:hypothetical protein KF728_25680 [Candidatus Obscuribacterales bacterium]|nr:hypothetical protein [Candidatus Obscuribacterales bacterium]MBX3153570.1 hypothetical protein [Candidatus Obscuribacterales bacterium]
MKTTVHHIFSPAGRFETYAEFRRQITAVAREQLFEKYAPVGSAGDKLEQYTKLGTFENPNVVEFAFVSNNNKMSAVMRAELVDHPIGGTEILYSMVNSRFNFVLVFPLSMFLFCMFVYMLLACTEIVPRLGHDATYWAVITASTAAMLIWFEIVGVISTRRRLQTVIKRVVAELRVAKRREPGSAKRRTRWRELKARFRAC